ncbi:hypothetical protein C8A00DRAFT_19338, partial [Chaetomidium leptoderma]
PFTNLLLIGATGFIGTPILHALLAVPSLTIITILKRASPRHPHHHRSPTIDYLSKPSFIPALEGSRRHHLLLPHHPLGKIKPPNSSSSNLSGVRRYYAPQRVWHALTRRRSWPVFRDKGAV